MKTSLSLLLVPLLLLMLIGCGPDQTPEPVAPAPPQTPAPDPTDEIDETPDEERVDEEPQEESPADQVEVSVRVIDEKEFEEVVQSYQGNVVLVDFWATWCVACIDLFPHTVELHERFADQGLSVISVSFDEPDSEDVVLEFLQQQGATFDNFISQYGSGIESADNFDLPGPLPYLMLFDRAGELAYTFPEPQSAVDPEAIDQAVEELLAATP